MILIDEFLQLIMLGRPINVTEQQIEALQNKEFLRKTSLTNLKKTLESLIDNESMPSNQARAHVE